MAKQLTIVLLVSLITVACGDKNAGTSMDNTIEGGLKSYLAQEKACFNAPDNFPIEKANSSSFMGKYGDVLNELVKAGLLTSEETQVRVLSFYDPDDKTLGKRFTVTSDGQAYIKAPGESVRGQTKICYGEYELIEVTNQVQQEGPQGKTVADVEYTYHIKNPATWILNSVAIPAQYGVVKKDLDSLANGSPLQGKAPFILTDEGWKHASLARM